MSATQRNESRFAAITNAAGPGTYDVIAAVAGKSIVVVNLNFTLTGTTPTALFQDTTPTALSGAFGVATAFAMHGSRMDPLMSTAKGAGLQMVLTGTSAQVRGCITYYLEDGQ